MTTNKPEVVAWRWRKPVVNDQGETIGETAWKLSDEPGFLPWWTNEPLIRLSGYEALQAENERLRQLLKELIGWIPSADTYRRLGFDPEAPMRAYEEAKAALSKEVTR